MSPLAQSTSWTEWLHNQVHYQTYFHLCVNFSLVFADFREETLTDHGLWLLQALINILYFCGMTGFVKEMLFQRYFSSDVKDADGGADVLKTIRRVSGLNF